MISFLQKIQCVLKQESPVVLRPGSFDNQFVQITYEYTTVVGMDTLSPCGH
jgi:hypothetical protein